MEGGKTQSELAALIEGSLTEMLRAKRGLKQGDPMSPLFFILVLEFLSTHLHNVANKGELELYSLGRCQVESLLDFVNDVNFFCNASRKSFIKLREFLEFIHIETPNQ